MCAKPSLFSSEKECFLCHTTSEIHRHHIYPGYGRREVAEREGAWVYLCGRHHNMSDFGVHFDKRLDRSLREMCQRKWEEREGLPPDNDHSDFIAVFGESYL